MSKQGILNVLSYLVVFSWTYLFQIINLVLTICHKEKWCMLSFTCINPVAHDGENWK